MTLHNLIGSQWFTSLCLESDMKAAEAPMNGASSYRARARRTQIRETSTSQFLAVWAQLV